MDSPLSYINSEGFRKDIMVKNLKPYAKSPNQPGVPFTYEYIQSNLAVVDSPDNLLDQSLPENKKRKSINKYGDGSESIIDSAPFFESVDRPVNGGGPITNNQPYPTSFVPSTYTPVSILLNPDPQGSDGLLSQDSFIVKLGAQTLRKEFEERIATQIKRQTTGRANILNVDGVSDVVNIIQGNVPLIEPNWTITIPENPILAASDFILRLGGSVLPISTIPGSYWDTNITMRQPSTIGQLRNAFRNSSVGNFVSNLLGTNQSGSQIFYNNTGSGQKSRLFYNIDFNKYKPSYDRTLFNRLAGALVGSTTDNSNFYIGSDTSNPSRILSPSGDLPINSYGQEQQVPVYGPSEIARQFDGASQSIRLGANGPAYSDGGGIEGGFTWVSPKYKGNAGKKAGLGGEISNEDEDFSPSSYSSTESTNNQFRDGSILDQTQRLIDSQPNGAKRLQHVGNAIDQVSKVFNDGYKEITKGSKVLSYVGAIGQEVGTEYCRVFTKDIPYLQYNDLQKTDGMTTEGRRFSWSVLDKTYNLNIVPNKQEGGKSSTNLISGEGDNLGYAKKYMFSLENLAWRTSSTPGYTYADLPICERGPNGGRVMWFPPYNLSFDESSTANWKPTDFIGRPEPIFTYSNTSRSGTLSWDIVVDHPSVLNLIVNKVLADQTNKERVNSIIDSFFAGCRKYDLYELAKKYYKINRNDLYELQKAITDKVVTDEQINYIKQTLQTGNDAPTNADVPVAPTLDSKYFKDYEGFGFYFENDKPAAGQVANYQFEYDLYLSPTVRNKYSFGPEPQQTNNFYENVIIPNFSVINKFIEDLAAQMEQYPNGNVTIDLVSSCSAPATKRYNDTLSARRMDSVVKYFNKSPLLKKYLEGSPKRLILLTNNLGEEASSAPKVFEGSGTEYIPSKFKTNQTIGCSDEDSGANGGDTVVGAKEVLTFNAMACRRVYIKSITSTLQGNVPEPEPIIPNTVDVIVENKIISSRTVPVEEQQLVLRNNITKRVLRSLLSECDYFEVIKETSPMVFDNLKDKLKVFQPAFHSITPEGLNSRLTFLNQCMRPGDTIPTVVEKDGEVSRQYNNATNTAFGAPPVLVLRIGDFYNTKIIPKNLSFKYENLDLNPEGIGVQPMIAKVTLSFDFVGGSGLKSSIDRLQNALSFNYYANTEMWDDRADVTDTSYEILDKEFLAAILTPQPPSPNQANKPTGQDNNSTIGTILTKTFGEFQTGTTTYSDFMVGVKDQTQEYFTIVVNKMRESVEQYNNAVRQQWILERNYTVGKFTVDENVEVKLFGKPKNIEKRFVEISNMLISDIDNDIEPFIKFILLPDRNFNEKLIRQIKQNYKRYITNKTQTFQNAITKIAQDIVNQQQVYLHTLGQVNTITFEPNPGVGTDGFQEKKGAVVIFNISGTTNINPSSKNVSNTFEELVQDVNKIKDDLILYSDEITKSHNFIYNGNKKTYSGILVNEVSDNGLQLGKPLTTEEVFIPFTDKSQYISNTLTLTFDNNFSFRRTYMFVSDDILDDKKYQTFKNEILGNILNNQSLIGKQNRSNISEVFDAFWLEYSKPIFIEENQITREFIDDMEKNVLKNFVNYTPFDKKERVFTYTSEDTSGEVEKMTREGLIKGLGITRNINNNLNTWNDQLISKVKLN
jgi:hypothetical protein